MLLTLLKGLPDKKASRIQLIKILFLLRIEGNIERYGSFYEFLPYKFGPFSFQAYKDISGLVEKGWIISKNDYFYYTDQSSELPGAKLVQGVIQSITHIIEDYGSISRQALLDYVYENYPWYASRSSIRHVDYKKAEYYYPSINTLGYEGLSIDGFLDTVLKNGIQAIIDVRSNPVSRKYGFSKPALANKCYDIGVEYHHFPEIGIPAKIRCNISDKQELWQHYKDNILEKNPEYLDDISDICQKERALLICYEREPSDCHRHIVAMALARKSNLPVIHFKG